GIDIFAKSVYRDLKQAGYCRADIVSFASSILGHITTEAKQAPAETVDSTASANV
ncbi:MAG: hypothetical protein RLZZ450_7161, partial [Pseudomonadota bacterium]